MESASLILELRATPEEVMRGVEQLHLFCRQHHVEEKAVHALMLSLEEMASNVMNHAYLRDPSQFFRVSIQHAGDRIVVELRDHGPAFDPLQMTDPDPDEDPDDRPEGGWGIQLVRHSMDELQYNREEEENVLRMTKRIQQNSV